MIRVHRLDGSQLVINAELIETVAATPDTVIDPQGLIIVSGDRRKVEAFSNTD